MMAYVHRTYMSHSQVKVVNFIFQIFFNFSAKALNSLF